MNEKGIETGFVFPDGLQMLAEERLNLPDVPADYLRDSGFYEGRITGVDFKKSGQMTFYLDGRRSKPCSLSAEEQGWLDIGRLTPFQVAVHQVVTAKPKFTRNPVQQTLFD